MSIIELCNYWSAQGELHNYVPQLSHESRSRKLYVSQSVSELLNGNETTLELRGARLQADLDFYVSGGLLQMCLTPHKAQAAYLGLLAPVDKGIWDIRSRDPKPGLRVFGGFAEPDTFIALVWRQRDKMGDKNDPEWVNAINECETKWKHFFHSYRPVTGDRISDYITANAIGSGDP